ncbi:peptidase S8/S53 domain-containing protein [Yarrowia lipolytica]|jgi:cerevisin|uniref:Peptidase S8/S53 domain-containing protein n=1 Tax=Yarrowia lipolytica TaxID=4952 RepID=A0A371C0K0_YARLL|nr:Alkaline extracellular protease [Yarrowia lipolytica]RDW23868.1 peptidase S8/S53 domain-containing protein [Yarrowia lipolytica]RDW37643.1 peptidase S8/S53 domain-containing protein [Yarrowia lipolytica]RDW45478.1 peptidase S8/S53 domain-containing protein [Yarrowia lipolytica]RDW52098.1 peptidase S8/S53 domain-containing protein [Yarrowia lipolytica]
MKLLSILLWISIGLCAAIPQLENDYAKLLSLMEHLEKRTMPHEKSEKSENSTIVLFSGKASISEKLAHVGSLVDKGILITKLYDISNNTAGNGVIGYVGSFTQREVQSIEDSDTIIDSVFADTLVYAQGQLEERQDIYKTVTNQPYHLARISHKQNPKGTTEAGKYSYIQYTSFPTNIYVLDSGIRTSHEAFGGRAQWGANFADDIDRDLGGHGTAVASMAAAVSVESTIWGVKVLQLNTGALSWIIAGLEWSINHATERNQKAVINMSVGSGAVDIYDRFMEIAQERNIVVTVAAGNNDQDACQKSPAKSSKGNIGVYTVGSTGDEDVQSGFSNWGDCVTLLAPGEGIKGASKDSDNGYLYWTGTSMSAPIFAGLVSYWMSISDLDYANLEYLLTRNTGLVTGLKGNTPNILAWNLHT